MNLFEEQLSVRKNNDEKVMEETLEQISGAVIGKKVSASVQDERLRSLDAINQVLGCFGKSPCDIPESVRDLNEQIEYAVRPHGLMYRTIRLDRGWYKNSYGVMLARKKEGSVTALIPGRMSGYYFFDTDGKKKKLNKETEKFFEEEAFLFYRPFPMKKLSSASLMQYAVRTLSVYDFIWVVVLTLIISLVGLLTPKINQLLFSTVAESGSIQLLLAAAGFAVCVSISSLLFGIIKSLINARIGIKISVSVQAAAMMRILALPADFFKKYSAGELSSRAEYIGTLCQTITDAVLTTGLTSIFSLIYIVQILAFAPALAFPALMTILATFIVTLIAIIDQMRSAKRKMELEVQNVGISYSLISGIQKIKLSGAEKRAFAHWGRHYAEYAERNYNPPAIRKLNSVFTLMISSAGMLAMYWFAVQSGVTAANYYAFNTSYGTVSSAFLALSSAAAVIAQIKPVLDMVKPILEAEPEIAESKHMVDRISGNIEINNLTFRYSENMPPVLNNLSLKIRAGQYVAIVGKTGCGKSTLIRLLLGFEKPQRGAVYYDGMDLSRLDVRSLRKKMGVVTQDGKLFYGDIYSNIVISAPHLTLDDAWKAAETAGIADDIRSFPMGMHTMIAEGAGGISGGQKQRLMIARAIAPKPKILIFDEATSALDNITQKKVSDALDKMNCTRIVVAHRLSTIRQCDRIIVLDGGRIVEDGTYDQLISNNGFFAELVERQRVE